MPIRKNAPLGFADVVLEGLRSPAEQAFDWRSYKYTFTIDWKQE